MQIFQRSFCILKDQDDQERNGEAPDAGQTSAAAGNPQAKRNVWEKPKKKKGGKNAAKHKKKPNFKPAVKKVEVSQQNAASEEQVSLFLYNNLTGN